MFGLTAHEIPACAFLWLELLALAEVLGKRPPERGWEPSRGAGQARAGGARLGWLRLLHLFRTRELRSSLSKIHEGVIPPWFCHALGKEYHLEGSTI